MSPPDTYKYEHLTTDEERQVLEGRVKSAESERYQAVAELEEAKQIPLTDQQIAECEAWVERSDQKIELRKQALVDFDAKAKK